VQADRNAGGRQVQSGGPAQLVQGLRRAMKTLRRWLGSRQAFDAAPGGICVTHVETWTTGMRVEEPRRCRAIR
jgi:hypothetical protein